MAIEGARARRWERVGDISRQPLVLCGFAVHAIAMFATYYRPIQMDPLAQASSIVTPTSLLFSLALAGLFALLGIAWRPVARWTRCAPCLIVATVIFIGAAVAESWLTPQDMPARACDFVARAAAVWLLIGWLQVFSQFESRMVLQAIPAILALGVAVASAITIAGPAWRLPAIAVLAIAGTLWLLAAQRATGIGAKLVGRQPTEEDAGPNAAGTELGLPAEDAESRSESDHDAVRGASDPAGTAPQAHPAALALLAVFSLSMLLGILCALPLVEGDSANDSPFFLYFLFMMGTALLLLALMTIFRRDEALSPAEVRLWLGAPCLLAALALIIDFVARPHIGPLANAIGRMIMELTLVTGFLLVARYFHRPPTRTMAFGYAAFLAGNSLGTFLGLGIPRLIPLGSDHLLVASAVILLLTTEALFLLVVLYRISQRIARRAAASPASMVSGEIAGGALGGTSDPETDKLDAFADAFRLSEKETEVLRLTVRGRSRQRIAETLYVSAGTVNTYFYRIYQKTGVHTRQELLDKIEEFPNEGN